MDLLLYICSWCSTWGHTHDTHHFQLPLFVLPCWRCVTLCEHQGALLPIGKTVCDPGEGGTWQAQCRWATNIKRNFVPNAWLQSSCRSYLVQYNIHSIGHLQYNDNTHTGRRYTTQGSTICTHWVERTAVAMGHVGPALTTTWAATNYCDSWQCRLQLWMPTCLKLKSQHSCSCSRAQTWWLPQSHTAPQWSGHPAGKRRAGWHQATHASTLRMYSPTSAHSWHCNRCVLTHVTNQHTNTGSDSHAPLPAVHPLAFWQWWTHHCQKLQWGRPHPCRRWSPSSWESCPRRAQLHWKTAPTAGGVACSHGDHTWHRVARTTVQN